MRVWHDVVQKLVADQRPAPKVFFELHAQGFGFVKTAEGEYFIPASKVNGAFPGDLVEVSRLSLSDSRNYQGHSSRRPTARVTKVLMRCKDTFIGRYEIAEPFGIVVPEDPAIPYDIFTLRRDAPSVQEGDIVEVQIQEFPTRTSAATGRVVRVLGSEDDVDIAVDLIIAEQQFETKFSESALQEANAAQFDANEAFVQGYRDLTKEFIFTIDPVDARDFDDAVSLERMVKTIVLGCTLRMCLAMFLLVHLWISMRAEGQLRFTWLIANSDASRTSQQQSLFVGACTQSSHNYRGSAF